jgi:hypothetical protein
MSGNMIFVLIFGGNIALKHLMGTSFRLLYIFGIFHTFYCSRVECVSLFEQLLDTLRIRAVNVRYVVSRKRLKVSLPVDRRTFRCRIDKTRFLLSMRLTEIKHLIAFAKQLEIGTADAFCRRAGSGKTNVS